MATDIAAERRLQRWIEHADPLEQQTAQVLATALASPTRSLLGTVQAVFDVSNTEALAGAARSLLDRPFVERVAEGYRIVEPMAALLRQQLRTSNPEAFREISRGYLADEQSLIREADNEERWFIRGRIAFYLAAFDPAEAAREFIATFAAPPPGDPGPQRSWLADLALRQRDLLETETRALDFFEGFRDYRNGRYRAARQHFARVIATKDRDLYRAISLHLWSVIADRDQRSSSRLREAVKLSESLGLTENEVMARNSLVFRLLGRATEKPGDVATLQQASDLAQINLRRAEETHDRFLITGARFGRAQALWLNFSDGGTAADRVPEEVVSFLNFELERTSEEAAWVHDRETAAAAINAAASIARDRGNYQVAAELLGAAYSQWRSEDPPVAARRWAKTAGSMLNLTEDPEVREYLGNLLDSLNAWLSGLDPHK